MYNMLIVDNEKIIADGLWDYFSDIETMDLEVYAVYSGREAIELLEKIKFDVVLSDIQMPGISGLELQQEVLLRWPRCKVIFLSGFDEFDYVHQAIRNGASNYILKTEGYEAIAEAVSKVLDELNESVRVNHFLSDARKQLQASLPLMQKDLMQRVLLGDPALSRSLKQQLDDCRIDLLDDEPVLLMVGRVDEWREAVTPSDKALMTFAIQNIAEEFLKPSVRLFSCAYESSRMIWAIQPAQPLHMPELAPEEDLHKRLLRFVQLTLPDIQAACGKLLRIPVSMALGRDFVDWGRLPEQFESLKLLLSFGLGTGREALLIESPAVKSDNVDRDASMEEPVVIMQIRMLQTCLENGERDDFFHLLANLMDSVSRQIPARKLVRLEIIMSLTGMLLSFINRWNLQREIGGSVQIEALARWEQSMSLSEYSDAIHRVAEALFHAKSNNRADEEHEVIAKIQTFVESRLDGDLTLTQIGEAFGYHPYYLSRLYKRITNQGMSEYIADARFKKAKELLQYSEMRIHDISAAVGFLSEKYFYRFFKKSAGITPQEFRDTCK